MSDGAWAMVAAMVLAGGALALLLYSTVRSIQVHRSGGRSIWREFGLGLALTLRRIEEHLGTLPPDAPDERSERWQLPDTSLQLQDQAERGASMRRTVT